MRLLKNIYASIYKEMIYYKRTLVNTIISMILFYVIFFLAMEWYQNCIWFSFVIW